MKKNKLTAIRFDKNLYITKFGYLDQNDHKVTHEKIVFNCQPIVDQVNSFLTGLIERHYPVSLDGDFLVMAIAIDYQLNEVSSLTFSIKFTGGETGEMSLNFPSLPIQILQRNSDLVDSLSDFMIAGWDEFQASLPEQCNLFAKPDLGMREQIEPRVNKSLEAA